VGRNEVSRQAFRSTAGYLPLQPDPSDDRLPVVRIKTADALKFCARLQELNRDRVGAWRFRLPTLQEWTVYSEDGAVPEDAVFREKAVRPAEAGGLDAFGLANVIGNVAEISAEDSGTKSLELGLSFAETRKQRVLELNNLEWYNEPKDSVGFRVVLGPP